MKIKFPVFVALTYVFLGVYCEKGVIKNGDTQTTLINIYPVLSSISQKEDGDDLETAASNNNHPQVSHPDLDRKNDSDSLKLFKSESLQNDNLNVAPFEIIQDKDKIQIRFYDPPKSNNLPDGSQQNEEGNDEILTDEMKIQPYSTSVIVEDPLKMEQSHTTMIIDKKGIHNWAYFQNVILRLLREHVKAAGVDFFEE